MKTVPVIGLNLEYNEEVSNKICNGWNMKDHPEFILNGKVIYNTSFYQHLPDTHTFPEDMTGVTFIKCNLDNCFIPPGNTVIQCTQRKIKVQNDLNDWIVDDLGNPVKPVDFNIYEKLSLPLPKPQDIPAQKVPERVDLIEEAKQAELEII